MRNNHIDLEELVPDLDTMDRDLAAIHRWSSTAPANAARDPEALIWGILAKMVEEAGEVMAAYVGVTGYNPRKGICDTMDHVAVELLDVALTALVAHAHIKVGASPMRALGDHITARMERGMAATRNLT